MSPTPGAPPPAARPSWKIALAVTLLMQSVAAFMSQSLPVLAPLLTGSAGLAPEAAGPLLALQTVGSMAFMILGAPILARLGPVRALQAGTALTAFGLATVALGTTGALFVASFLMGVGYGPTNPAGSRILSAASPARHRSLIFSIKQAGAPLGGVLAGLAVAPLAAAAGWPMALVLVTALALVAVLVIQPARHALDAERDAGRPIGPRHLLGRHNLSRPFTALRLHPAMLPLTGLACSFAVAQGSLQAFVVTWLTTTRDLTLVQAGAVYAAIQTGSVVARVVMGWAADRSGRPALTLVFQALTGAALVAVFALIPAGTDYGVLLAVGAVTGALIAGWNGIYQSEIARLSPPERIAEATAGSTTLTFVGYSMAPVLYAAVVAATGSWLLPQLFTAVQLAVVALLVGPRLRRLTT
ncbi:MFS transporter [Muricoccus radiodurans]|uniref:MFS transporter n=1 Tax=Muricoccus radiodurans TaxID=2231721 RepID=UPI003CEAADD8